MKARSIQEIKEQLKTAFMGSDFFAALYDFASGSSFDSEFSKASVENTWMYIFSLGIHNHERVIESYASDTQDKLENMKSGKASWYARMTLNFMKGHLLIPDTDTYDTQGMNESQMEEAKVVKYAVAVENEQNASLIIKVAGEENGRRIPLSEEDAIQLNAYVKEIKYAGVVIELINAPADTFNCTLDIYYTPMLDPVTVENNVRSAIAQYVENLPFNGVYTNMELVDAVQKVEGVKIVEFVRASGSASETQVFSDIHAKQIPYAGYYKIGQVTIHMHPYA